MCGIMIQKGAFMNKITFQSDDQGLKQQVEQYAKSIGVEFEVQVDTLPVSSLGTTNVVSFPVQAEAKSVQSMAQLESSAIVAALEACRGNYTETAKALKIGRATLYRKVKEYAIDTKVSRTKAA